MKRFIRWIKSFFKKPEIIREVPPMIVVAKPKTDDATRLEGMFDAMIVKPEWKPTADYVVEKILDNKNRYINVSNQTGVPWEVIAAIHSLEGSLRFDRILHNGEKLPVKKTRLVPKNRGPFNTWEESAIDALAIKRKSFPSDWSVGSTLDFLEKFNGLGYRKYHKHVPSPYIWSGTDYYTKGKYASDGKFDNNLISEQLGAAIILKELGY